jgi:hypothetical protein
VKTHSLPGDQVGDCMRSVFQYFDPHPVWPVRHGTALDSHTSDYIGIMKTKTSYRNAMSIETVGVGDMNFGPRIDRDTVVPSIDICIFDKDV